MCACVLRVRACFQSVIESVSLCAHSIFKIGSRYALHCTSVFSYHENVSFNFTFFISLRIKKAVFNAFLVQKKKSKKRAQK